MFASQCSSQRHSADDDADDIDLSGVAAEDDSSDSPRALSPPAGCGPDDCESAMRLDDGTDSSDDSDCGDRRTDLADMNLDLPRWDGNDDEDAPYDAPPPKAVTAPVVVVEEADGAVPGEYWKRVYAAAMRQRVTSGPWTHSMGDVRVNLTEPGLAAAVYAVAEELGEHGIAVTERRLSAVARLRIEVRFKEPLSITSFGPGAIAHAVASHVSGVVARRMPEPNQVHAGAVVANFTACIVLQPTLVDDCYDRLWFHFPGAALAMHEIVRLRDALTAIPLPDNPSVECTVLSTGASQPLYGCDDRAMRAVGIVYGASTDAGQFPPDWVPSTADTEFRRAAYHNDGVSWIDRPVLDAAEVRARIAVLCSINPMGTPALPMVTLASLAAMAAGLPVPSDVVEVLQHGLRLLSPRRRADPDDVRTVGKLIHTAAKGAYWGLRHWAEWATAESEGSSAWHIRMEAEYYAEWATFGGDCVDEQDNMDALSGLVFADATEAEFTEFSRAQLRIVHRNRPLLSDGADDTLRVWGGLSHYDIAQFLMVHLHGTMRCVNARSGLWFVYRPDQHRWEMDEVGMEAMLRCAKILHEQLDLMRREVTEAILAAARSASGAAAAAEGSAADRNNAAAVSASANAGGAGAAGPGARGVSNVFQMANWGALCGADDLRIKREIVVHLDRQLGDFRNLQGIMKMLATQLHNKEFHRRLDVTNEHILPFANGVLDLKTLQFRNGQPSDMVMKGPTYAFHDYDADDPLVQDMERMLAQIFTDTSLLDFFLTFGASLLRRRNRFKHFYIMTGGTNAGKSQILNIIKQGLGTLCGTLPIQAITARELSASGQTDYLARTQGMAICVCHEPDSSTQQLLNDRVKVMTSDSDQLSVREMYGREKEMMTPPMPICFSVGHPRRRDHVEARHGVQPPAELQRARPRHAGPLRLHPVQLDVLQKRVRRTGAGGRPVPAAQVPRALRPGRRRVHGTREAPRLPLLHAVPFRGDVATGVRARTARAHPVRARRAPVRVRPVPRLPQVLRAPSGQRGLA